MTATTKLRRTVLLLAAGSTALALASYGVVNARSPEMLTLSASGEASTAARPRKVPTPPKPGKPVPPNPNGDSGKTPVIQWKSSGAKGYVSYAMDYVVEQVGSSPTPYWYWATQMGFQKGDAFYMGLQPDFGSKNRALFSVFGAGTEPLADTCSSGADGGSGTSCSIQYDWKPGKTYRLTVTRLASDSATSTWRGTVRDLSTTAPATQIGKWSVPAAWGVISPAAMSWSEWFNGNVPCSSRTKNSVYVRYPLGTSANGKRYRETLASTTEGTCAGFTPVEGWVLTRVGA
jgi:hypothetical protein